MSCIKNESPNIGKTNVLILTLGKTGMIKILFKILLTNKAPLMI